MAVLLLAASLPPLPLHCGVVDQSDAGLSLVEGFDGALTEWPLALPEGAVVCEGRVVGRRRGRARHPALPLHSTLEELSR